MDNLKEVERFIRNVGWYAGRLKLDIQTESEFEGFSGRASETWETRVTIEIKSPDETKAPTIKVVGKTGDDIDKVAGLVLEQIKNWKIK